MARGASRGRARVLTRSVAHALAVWASRWCSCATGLCNSVLKDGSPPHGFFGPPWNFLGGLCRQSYWFSLCFRLTPRARGESARPRAHTGSTIGRPDPPPPLHSNRVHLIQITTQDTAGHPWPTSLLSSPDLSDLCDDASRLAPPLMAHQPTAGSPFPYSPWDPPPIRRPCSRRLQLTYSTSNSFKRRL